MTAIQSVNGAFGVADSAIAELSSEYMAMHISGVDDSDGFAMVHDARMVVKRKRIDVEKKRKELVADALEYQRSVNAEAKRITALLEPIESHLQSEEDAYEAERARIRREEEEQHQSVLKKRVDMFAAVGVAVTTYEVDRVTDAALDEWYAAAKGEYETRKRVEAEQVAERAKQEAEAAAKRREEESRLAAERAELDRQRKEQEAEAARLAAERRAVEAAEREAQKKSELERLRRESEERARIESEKRHIRDLEIAKAKAAAEESARKRAEQLKPDYEKLLSVAKAVNEITVPAVSLDAADASQYVAAALYDCAEAIKEIARQLMEAQNSDTTAG